MIVCKSCGAEVVWKKESVRWQCYQPDGRTVHWDACSARRWDQVKMTGERFETAERSGYRNSVHGTKLDRISVQAKGTRPLGVIYRGDPPCRRCVPAWEVCPNGCPASKNETYRPVNGVTEFVLEVS